MFEEFREAKEKLWERLNKANEVNVHNNKALNRLLSFIETPSAPRPFSQNKTFLPKISSDSCIINQTNYADKVKRPSFLLDSKDSFINNFSRLQVKELMKVIRTDIKIDEEKGFSIITPEIAVGLRQLTLGSLRHQFSADWRESYFSFKSSSESLCYSFYSEKICSRSLTAVVQAFFLKNLLFKLEISNESRNRLLNVSEGKRKECLIKSFAEMLWLVGDGRRACLCVMDENSYIDSSPYYVCDNITEKIHVFKFKSQDLLINAIRKSIHFFTTSRYPGYILLLYSVALSRGLQQLFEDFEYDTTNCLISSRNDTLNQCAVNLMLTGRATDYTHNGVVLHDPNSLEQIRPLYGVKERASIGYLQYQSPVEDRHLYLFRRASEGQTVPNVDLEQISAVGSMLKTPFYPIWVTNVNGRFGVLFCLQDDLLYHWRAEANFKLMYVNFVSSQKEPCILDVCTRRGRTAKFRTSTSSTLSLLSQEKKRIPLLNHLINTKWYGCRVEWNGQMPFV